VIRGEKRRKAGRVREEVGGSKMGGIELRGRRVTRGRRGEKMVRS